MDNGDSFLDVIDGDLFGGQNDSQSSLLNWADEFLGDELDASSSAVAMESGNLATNVNQPNHILSTQNYAVTSSIIPAQNVAIATSQFLSSPAAGTVLAQQTSTMLGQAMVTASPQSSGLTTQLLQQSNTGNQQQFILRTSSGNQIQLNRQALQFQQQILQQQQQTQQQQQHNVASTPPFHQILSQQSAIASPSASIMSRSNTPNADGLSSYSGGSAVTQTVTQLRASPSPNVNLVHLPPNIQQQQQQQLTQPQTHQFQIAPGTILQIPAGASGASQNFVSTTLFQGQQAFLGNNQQGTLVNAQNTVIQNPNVVNVNVAAQHVLCNPSQQPRTNIGLANLQTASPSPFNIQGTLIQTAEGKSILIPSQNLAQPINIQGLSVAAPPAQSQPISIQGLSVATPIAQHQIQQPAQNTVANMLQLAQQQQQTGINVDNRTGQGVQQLVLNHQGQQILVQRAPNSTGQPQNIIVRTAGGQQGIVQLQQRAPHQQVSATQLQSTGGQTAGQAGIVQLQQRSGQTTLQSAQQTLQALAGNQQIKFVNQGNTSQQMPVINIGGQNVSLQHITNQLNNLQGLKIQQQQQQQQQQQTIQQQTQLDNSSLNFQSHDQSQSNNANTNLLTLNQGQVSVNQLVHNQVFSQPNVISSQVPVIQTSADSSADSVENQTRLILQKIHNSLKKSQADALNNAAATVSNIQALQHKSVGNIKQEPVCTMTSSSASSLFYPQVSVKSETNLMETLIKQEKGVSSACGSVSASSIQALFTCTAQNTCTSSTLSQASTPMSLYLLSNSQNVQSNSSLTSVPTMGHSNLLMSASSDSSGVNLQGTTVMNNSSVMNSPAQSVVQSTNQTASMSPGPSGTLPQTGQSGTLPQAGQTGSATLQTIHLPPELQQQLQRVQLEIRKVQTSPTMTPQQKREKLQQLQVFQKRILLKGRVLATSKTETSQSQLNIEQALQSSPSPSSTSLSSSESSSQNPQSRTGYMNANQSNSGLKNLLRQQGDSTTQEQPDSTSNLGQGSQSSNSLAGILGAGSATSTTVAQSSLTPSQSPSLTQTTTSVSQNVAMTTQSIPASTATSTDSSVPQVAVPTQIKIADKVLTLNLTPAQKDKVQSYLDRMTPDQQQQYLQTQQHVLHRIQKQQALKAQIQAQAEAQKKRSEMAALSQNSLSNQSSIQKQSQNGHMPTPDILNGKPDVKTIPVPNTRVSTQLTSTTPTTVIRGQKRSYMDIPKGTLINQQIRQDQNHASNPDTKRPFRSRGDACRRLLRYHVFQTYGPSPDDFNKFDSYMEDISEELLKKKDRMFDKFRQLLVHETLRVHPSSELVMLQRMQNQDLKKTLEEERLLVKQDPESFEPMPMRFLCKKEERSPGSPSEAADTVDVKQEPTDDINDVSSETSNNDSAESIKTEIKEETTDLEEIESGEESRAAKMRKLVIKTDGMNFRSSFKRVSLDSSRSSVDEQGSHDRSMNSDVSVSMDVDDDDVDDNTNDYSNDKFENIHDEDEKAVLTISSAEDSQSTQMDSHLDVYFVDNSLSQNATDHGDQFFKERRNFEITKDSVLNCDSESIKSVKKPTDFSSFTKQSNMDDRRSYIPKNLSDKSIASSLNETEDSDLDEKFSGYQPMTDTLTDKFSMYQPITESLTDSEENSYYSADNAADQKSVMRDNDNRRGHSHWKKIKKIPPPVDSDEDSDPEVKAQMESAINSILSLGPGASNEPEASYSYSSQSNQFFNQDSQSNSLYSDSNSLQADLNFQTNISPSLVSSKVSPESSKSSSQDFTTDLDAAVNSILM